MSLAAQYNKIMWLWEKQTVDGKHVAPSRNIAVKATH